MYSILSGSASDVGVSAEAAPLSCAVGPTRKFERAKREVLVLGQEAVILVHNGRTRTIVVEDEAFGIHVQAAGRGTRAIQRAHGCTALG